MQAGRFTVENVGLTLESSGQIRCNDIIVLLRGIQYHYVHTLFFILIILRLRLLTLLAFTFASHSLTFAFYLLLSLNFLVRCFMIQFLGTHRLFSSLLL